MLLPFFLLFFLLIRGDLSLVSLVPMTLFSIETTGFKICDILFLLVAPIVIFLLNKKNKKT